MININGNALANRVLNIIKGSDEERNSDNGNKDSRTITTRKELVCNEVSETIGIEMLPERVRKAHKKEIYYHDLNYSAIYPIFNCMTINITEMFTNGFKLGVVDIKSPQSFKTFCNLVSQVIANVSSNVYGGVTVANFDEVGEIYVTRTFDNYFKMALNWVGDNEKANNIAMDLTEKEVMEGTQALEYNINSIFTQNGQTPFTSIGFGLGTSWQSRMIQKGILKQRINGLGKNRKTAVFPKLIFALKEGVNVNENDPNYDIKQLALECCSKRIYPDIVSVPLMQQITGATIFPRGCRSFAGLYIDPKTNKPVVEGRNCLGVVSINLPRLALKSKGDLNKFYEELEEALDIAHEGLQYKISRFEGVTADISPILYMEGALGVRLNAKDKISEIFKNGYSSIALGYVGLEECVKALTGHSRHENKQYKELSINILKILKEHCDLWKKQEGYLYSLYGTPSETTGTRFVFNDREDFGIIEGVTDKDYYTNSFHVEANTNINAFDRIDFEKEYPSISTGGFISYTELPSLRNNLKALESIWDYQYKNTPYSGVNQPVDKCFECGFEGELIPTDKGYVCPHCLNDNQETLQAIKRISGYLADDSIRPVNKGKKAEFKARVKNI